MREYGNDAIYEAIQKATKSSFLNGGGNRGFCATFDWIFLPTNFPKIIEGNYDDGIRQTLAPQLGLDNSKEKFEKGFSW